MIKLGVIGSNFVSDWLCDAVRASGRFELYAIYSRTYEKAEEYCQRQGFKKAFASLDEFFDCGIEALYIASPNFCHYEQAYKALEKGLHVLVEKPATLNKKQFSKLLSLAEKKGVVLVEAMRPVHDVALDKVRKALDEIGKIRRVSFEYCQYSSRYDAFRRGEVLNAFKKEFGNSALMDIGCYLVEACVCLFGKPKSISSKSVKLHNGFEAMGSAIFDYGDFIATLDWSKITESVNPSVIAGEDGSILFGKISTLEYVKKRLKGQEEITLLDKREESNMLYEVINFADMICNNLPAKPFNDITLTSLEIMDYIRKENKINF